jgi:hypothetical protein
MTDTAAKELPTAMVRVLALDKAALALDKAALALGKAADGVAVRVTVAVAADVGTVVQPWGTAWLRHKPAS